MEAEAMNAKPQVKTLQVLVADDDAPTRILLKAAITQWGYEVIEAKDGEEAWQIMSSTNPPRLLIVDWLMPKLDGIQLCERSKTQLKPRPYIILLTQMQGSTNINKGLEAGADEFLSKPFNMAELRSRLETGAKIIGYNVSFAAQNQKMNEVGSSIVALANQALGLLTDQKNKNEIEDKLKKIIEMSNKGFKP